MQCIPYIELAINPGFMKINKKWFFYLLFSLAIIGIGWISNIKPPILHKSLDTESFGTITISEPMWGSGATALVFIDSKKYPATALGERIAANGITAVVVDAFEFFKGFSADSGQCLDAQHLATSLDSLLNMQAGLPEKRLIISGIAEGALIPFVNAQPNSTTSGTNLSIGFSVSLPKNLLLCPPYLSQLQNQNLDLVSSPVLDGNWLSVWTDQPAQETAVFIRALGNIDTKIAAYDTPLDDLLIAELNTIINQNSQSAVPMPVVEVPAGQTADNATIFYSGDGGWRDLDRTVAGEMATQNYPVVGVDVLRYFWERKTAEQAAADLTATMAYYRKKWGVKSFVLAGYSFGADILPAIYNRLPQQDKDSVSLLALLALAKDADFEIHVSGWLGQNSEGSPLAPELKQIPNKKLLCIYGKEEKSETACTVLQNSEATILELPGGHHFDQDYPKLTRQILDVYRQHGIISRQALKP